MTPSIAPRKAARRSGVLRRPLQRRIIEDATHVVDGRTERVRRAARDGRARSRAEEQERQRRETAAAHPSAARRSSTGGLRPPHHLLRHTAEDARA